LEELTPQHGVRAPFREPGSSGMGSVPMLRRRLRADGRDANVAAAGRHSSGADTGSEPPALGTAARVALVTVRIRGARTSMPSGSIDQFSRAAFASAGRRSPRRPARTSASGHGSKLRHGASADAEFV